MPNSSHTLLKQSLFLALLLALFVACAFSNQALAAPSTLQIMGQMVEADEIGYYAGTTTISDFVLTHPVTFTFARGNKISADGLVFLETNGNISVIASNLPQTVNWLTPHGQSVALDCGAHPFTAGVGKAARVIQFHPNLEYKGGCDLIDDLVHQTELAQVTLGGEIDVDTEFNPLYVQYVRSGMVFLGSNWVEVKPHTSIAFYETGHVRFLSMVAGESFSANEPIYGSIKVFQRPEIASSTSFFIDGSLERGLVGEDLLDHELNFKIPSGSGVSFDDSGFGVITDVIFSKPSSFTAKQYALRIQTFSWDMNRRIYEVVLSEKFDFLNPDTHQQRTVPAGSHVVFNMALDVISISEPIATPAQ